MKNRIVSIFLSLCLLTSVLSVGIIQTAAADAGTATVEQLAQETVQGSAILHCFNWSYNSIKANLPDIAAAGYTAVQTSPVQPPKDYNAGWTDVSGQWWKMYQPLDLRLADGGTWLGTKAELKSMCDEADKYGIKVIVDVVANHLANNGTNGGTFSNLNSGAANDMKNANYYHSDSSWANDDNRYNITQRHIGMPDLNTSNSYVQQKVIAMLKDCVDCGVDGFRFDAAKHIEVPNDNSAYASRFWQNVIDSINSYQSGLYIYGEILGGAGIDISNYTQYMDVTDDYTGTLARQAVRSQNSDSLHSNYYQKGVSADQAVLWAESHDTYMNSDGDSKNDTNDTIVKTWAIMGSRADSTALFFARPGNSAMGEAAGDTTWKSAAVAEVNKFKNAFEGTGEYLDFNGNTAYNVRGGKGAVISKLDGAGSVSLDAHGMPDGSYTDRVTGNSFTVSNGTLSGTVGSTGVAVVYNPQDVAREYITADALYLDPADISWQAADARYTMYLFSGSKSEWVDMTAADVEGFYTSEVPEGRWTGVIFCRMKGNTTENVWDNVMYQTADLFPADENDCFTINGNKEGNNYLGDWSVFAPHDHTYGGTPVWQWASDYSTATAVFACTVCGRTQSVAATVTSDVQEDVTVYTATASFNEQTYTDTQIAENASAKDMLYLQPNDNWKQDGARFAAYFFGNNGDAWASMTPTCDGNHYQVEIPEGSWTKVIFCRMNGNTTDNNWNDGVKWNQTDDLSYTVGQCYAVEEGTWDKGGGTWSDYTPEHDYQAAWTWNGTASATAVLTCKNGDSTKTLPATVTSSVTTEPTCNTAGERTYTASVSFNGATYTDTKTDTIPANATHRYADEWTWANDYSAATLTLSCEDCAFSEVIEVSGDAVKTDNTVPGRVAHTATAEYSGSTFTDTQYESLAAPVIVYKSISLHDEIGMNFYVNLPESGNAENTDVTYTWNGETVEGALKPSSKYPGLYRTDFSLPARAMTDQVTVSVSFGSLTAEETYRVVDYAQSAASTYADNASLRLLLCNMLDYGAAAQIQFGYHTDDLASDYIAAVDSGWSRADAPAALNDSTDIAEVSNAFGIEYVGATMTTTSKTAVRLFFKVTDEQVFADTTASLNNVELTFKQHPGYEELRYLEISDLAAGEIFQNNTIVFGNNANNESRIYSAANYYNAVIEGDYADSFKTVMQTMYNYYDSARALEV